MKFPSEPRASSWGEEYARFVNECKPLLEDASDGTKFFGRKLLDRIA